MSHLCTSMKLGMITIPAYSYLINMADMAIEWASAEGSFPIYFQTPTSRTWNSISLWLSPLHPHTHPPQFGQRQLVHLQYIRMQKIHLAQPLILWNCSMCPQSENTTLAFCIFCSWQLLSASDQHRELQAFRLMCTVLVTNHICHSHNTLGSDQGILIFHVAYFYCACHKLYKFSHHKCSLCQN